MKVTCTGRRVTLKPSFIENAEKRLAKLDKFFPDEAQAQVTVTVEKSGQTVEIMLRSKDLAMRAEKTDERMEDALAAQTTQDRRQFETLRAELDQHMDTSVRVLDTICDATRQRQEEAQELSDRVDAMVVVGGRSSGNTRYRAGRKHGYCARKALCPEALQH